MANKVYIGADHAGFMMKEQLKKWLIEKGIDCEDMGAHELNPTDDYPDFAAKVGRKVVADKNSRGILVCTTGVGIAIAADKIQGVRAVHAYDLVTAKESRADNDTNVLALRTDGFSLQKNKSIVDMWLTTPFSGIDRHQRRLDKIAKLERERA